MLSFSGSQAKHLGVILNSPLFLRPNIQLTCKFYRLYFQNWSWEFTVSALSPLVQTTLPATCGILLFSLIWSLSFCSSSILSSFDLNYLNQITLLSSLKTSHGFSALMANATWWNLAGPESLPGLGPVPHLIPWASTLASFLFPEFVKLVPTLQALHLLFPPPGRRFFSIFVCRSLFQCHPLKVASGHPVWNCPLSPQ